MLSNIMFFLLWFSIGAVCGVSYESDKNRAILKQYLVSCRNPGEFYSLVKSEIGERCK